MSKQGRILIKSIFVLAIFALSIKAIAVWVDVPADVFAPDGGIDPPITSGANPQSRDGAFAVVGFRNFSTTVLDGNVGIGTETPSAKLDVAGTFKFANGTEGAGKILISDANGLTTWTSSSVFQTPWNQPVFANNNALYGGTSPSARLTLDSTTDALKGNIVLNPNGGKVGIGTLNPLNTLHVNGDARIDGLILLNGQEGTSGQYLKSNGVLPPTWTTIPDQSATIQDLQNRVTALEAQVQSLQGGGR